MGREVDILVVGGGGSGLAAAVSAAQQGARVALLEKEPQLGGTTGIAIGSFTAAGTSLQRTAGVEDDVEQHAVDAGLFAPPEIEACNNAELRRYFLEHAAETFAWLQALGLSFYGPSPEPPNRLPRMHNVVPNAKAYIAALQARLLRSGGEIHTGTIVTGLTWDNGRVVGVTARQGAGEVQLRARRAVIIAGGDYASAPDLIARFKGPQFASVEGINPAATGDGHRLLEQAGAQLINMHVTYGPELRFIAPARRNVTQILPTRGPVARLLGWLAPWTPRPLIHAVIKRLLLTWQHPEDRLFADGAILINRHGRRFCNERESPTREIAVAGQPEKQCFILLDERLCDRYSRWPHFISTAPKIAYAYVADYLRLRPDVAIAAPTLPELAARRGLPADALTAAVAEFNESVMAGSTDRWGRAGDAPPLAGQRWVLLGPAKAYFTTTEGGAAIDHQLRVLDAKGQPIPGLYAVGQTGLGGMILWGHGLHIAWALTSGRLAGQFAAADSGVSSL